jgi:hypothetical protein
VPKITLYFAHDLTVSTTYTELDVYILHVALESELVSHAHSNGVKHTLTVENTDQGSGRHLLQAGGRL